MRFIVRHDKKRQAYRICIDTLVLATPLPLVNGRLAPCVGDRNPVEVALQTPNSGVILMSLDSYMASVFHRN